MRYINVVGYFAIPAAYAAHFLGKGAGWEPIVTFVLAAMGVIPLAQLMGESTEHLAERAGPTWGGLLNATFGNAAELIIGVIAISRGLNEMVKASLTGSILGNLLLVGGVAMLAGGWKRERQTFSPMAAETNAGMLALAVAAMLFPAIFHVTAVNLHDLKLGEHERSVSLGTSFILIAVYSLGLLFTLRTHAHIFSRPGSSHSAEPPHPGESWSVTRSVTMLLLASVGIAIVAELLVGAAETMAHQLGWSQIFVGVILLAIIGNAAEHSTAVMLARRDNMETAMTITYQSSLQIALFATPALVLISEVMAGFGWGESKFMDVMFSPMEIVAVLLAVGIVVVLGMNGETNWFEGVLLLALYAILAIAFFYIPASEVGGVQSLELSRVEHAR
ncbi:MAG: calcium/proton exchanger [Bacillota bacterium]